MNLKPEIPRCNWPKVAGIGATTVLIATMWVFLVMLGCGCTTTPPKPPIDIADSNAIPNLVLTDFGARGGQPEGLSGWKYLASIGVSNVIKLDTPEQGDDSFAEMLGMAVHRHPVTTEQQLRHGPDPGDFTQAVSEIIPAGGNFIHCLHGEDRTGLLVGQYRVTRMGWPKEAAYQEMRTNGFHRALIGLQEYWDNLPSRNPPLPPGATNTWSRPLKEPGHVFTNNVPVTLAWDYATPPDDTLRFNLYMAQSLSPPVMWIMAATIPGTNRTFTMNLSPGTSYFWTVTASNLWGESDFSEPVGLPPLPRPIGTLRITRGN